MISQPVQFNKEAVKFFPQDQTFAESTYIVYVPQLVTLRYPLPALPSPLHLHSQPPPTLTSLPGKPSDPKAQRDSSRKIIRLRNKRKQEDPNTSKKERKGKINITSSRFQPHPSPSNLQSIKKQHQQRNSEFRRISTSFYEELSLPPAQPSHIKVDSVLSTMACDFFQCNGLEGIDEFERKPIDFSISHQKPKGNSREQCQEFVKPIDKSFGEMDSLTNESLRKFKRKNIFQRQNRLDASRDALSFGKSSEHFGTKTRKAIFGHKQYMSQSLSLERSLSRRRKIFGGFPSSPKFGIKKEEETFEGADIPSCVLESWQVFESEEESVREEKGGWLN